MAFLNSSDIVSGLPPNSDLAIVDRLLATIEAELRSKNIVFEEISSTIRDITCDSDSNINNHSNYQSVFSFDYLSEITSVKIKRRGEISETALTLHQDFILAEYSSIENHFNQLHLIEKQMCNPHYLEITGKFGLHIAFSTSNLTANLLKSSVTEFIRNQLALRKNNGQGVISSASEAGSSISFATSTIDNSRSVLTSPDMRSFFDYIC